MELTFIRIIGAILTVGCSATLAVCWANYGIPVGPEDWAACIAINMMFGILVVFGLIMMTFKD